MGTRREEGAEHVGRDAIDRTRIKGREARQVGGIGLPRVGRAIAVREVGEEVGDHGSQRSVPCIGMLDQHGCPHSCGNDNIRVPPDGLIDT